MGYLDRAVRLLTGDELAAGAPAPASIGLAASTSLLSAAAPRQSSVTLTPGAVAQMLPAAPAHAMLRPATSATAAAAPAAARAAVPDTS
jgi:hypothetical protein